MNTSKKQHKEPFFKYPKRLNNEIIFKNNDYVLAFKLWLAIACNCSYDPNFYNQYKGSFRDLANKTGLSLKQVRYWINWLVKTGYISYKVIKEGKRTDGTYFKILNYNLNGSFHPVKIFNKSYTPVYEDNKAPLTPEEEAAQDKLLNDFFKEHQ